MTDRTRLDRQATRVTLMLMADGVPLAADGPRVGRFSRYYPPQFVPMASTPRNLPQFVHAITGAVDFLIDDRGRRFQAVLLAPRLRTLRHQAHRKGRPGWRAIRHPRPAGR